MKRKPSSKSFWKEIPKPIIGLAPMDGYSDSAFRQTCKAVNPNILTYTEFTSADGIHYGANTIQRKLAFEPSERPILAQIFGKNTETFITAAKLCEDMGFTGIDINMGCPSKKVVRSEHGVALRRNPALAYKLIETLANATCLPISVKTRLGWHNGDDLVEFGIGAEQAGADMICIHARTYQNPYNVPAQWGPVIALKEAVSIPVLGNGGIERIEDGLRVCEKLDGFLIGQASFGNPWVFDPSDRPRSFAEKVPLIIDHARWLVQSKGEAVGTREIRKHLVQYIKGIRGARQWRRDLVHVDSLKDIEQKLQKIVEWEICSPQFQTSLAT